MSEKTNRYLKWNRLDNTAHLFPVIAREGMSNVYRVSAVLKEDIDGELLQQALETELPLFDAFRCSLKKGFFWYYLEENRLPAPRVKEEYTYPCRYLNPYSNNKYLFRLSYYGRRINLEVFHAVADGNGALGFLKEITYAYLRLAHPELDLPAGNMPDQETSFDVSDSYVQNYRQKQEKPYRSDRAVLIKGERLPADQIAVITGIVSVRQVRAAAKKYGVTINQYLVAVYAWAIYTAYMKSMPSAQPLRVCVPVNLRPVFGSDTSRNFFAMAAAVFRAERSFETFEEVLEAVIKSLEPQMTKEGLERLFSYNVSNQMNAFLRIVPLPIKSLVMKSVYRSSARGTTTTLTNLGLIDAARPYDALIERFQAIIAMSVNQELKLAVISYKDVMTITFSSALKESLIQKTFFRKLAEDGAEAAIETNGVYYE